jgi:tetratricopeptide (TPR) repeat protein
MFGSHSLKIACAVAVALVASGCGRDNSHAAPAKHARETKDRWSDEQIENMVAGPMAAVRNGGLAQGEAAFDSLLKQAKARSGENSAQVADLITAFGVQLFTEGKMNGDSDLKNASIAHLKTAVNVYRAAFGRMHPEVALALTTYADAALGIDEDVVPPGSEEALEEAARIRLQTLGPSNAETRATYITLAELRGRPDRIQAQEQRLGKVETEFEKLIDSAPNDPALRDTSAPMIRFVLANTYAKNGRGQQALNEANRAIKMMEPWPTKDRCENANLGLLKLQAALEHHHQASLASEVENRQPFWHLLSCTLNG